MVRNVRRLLFGVGFPLLLLIGSITYRIHIQPNLRPYQAEWILWLASVVLMSILIGWGLCSYWTSRSCPPERRR